MHARSLGRSGFIQGQPWCGRSPHLNVIAAVECGRVVPRLPLGSDDEVVVKVAWEGWEEAESTWEPVSRVLDGSTAVLRKELKALRLTMDRKRGLVQRYGLRFWSCCGFGGMPNFELLLFGFIEMLNFEVFLTWNFRAGR